MTGAEKVFCFHSDGENVNGRTWKGTAIRKHVHHDPKTFTTRRLFGAIKD